MLLSSSMLPLLLFIGGGGVICSGLEIGSAQELINLANSVNTGASYSGTTVFLNADLDLAGETIAPIGNEQHPFFGTFDGQGHTISNLRMSLAGKDVGLFGFSKGATIRNVVIDGTCSFESSYNDGFSFVGGILGRCESEQGSCTIESSVNMGSLVFSGSASGNVYIGGIVGSLHSTTYEFYVKNCANYGPITHPGNANEYTFLGGIVGECFGTTTKNIRNCLNYGSISYSGTTTGELRLGGITGNGEYVHINNCLSGGIISVTGSVATKYVGSVVGASFSNTKIEYSFFTSDTGVSALYEGDTPASTAGSPNSSSSESFSVGELNSRASNKGWNKCLLNTNSASVSLKINNNKGFSVSSKVVLLYVLQPTGSSNTFIGWYNSTEYSEFFQAASVAGTTTLYGLYGTIVTVTFEGNGGSTPSFTSKNVVKGSEYEALPSGERTGYDFTGWYTAINGGAKVESSTVVSTESDHTLYAQWSVNSYTVTFNENGGGTPSKTTMSVTYDDFYGDLPTASRTGYDFTGWFTEATSGGTKIESTTRVTITSAQTLYAHWSVKSYTVTFNKNDGDSVSETSITVTYDDIYGELPTASRTGHTFTGWYTATSGGKEIESTTRVSITSNQTLFAHWRINSYNLTFDFNNETEDEVRVLKYNSEISYPEEPTRTGYTFDGWDKDITTMPAENVTITAQWKINSYKATFAFGNGEKDEEKSVKYKDPLAYPKEPEREGYTFDGWDKDIKTMPAENVTITAQWNINQYTITFVFNNGTENEVRTLDFNEEIVFPEDVLKTGYSFIEWNSKQERMPAENITITALWIPNNYTVTFDANGVAIKEKSVTYDDFYGELPEANRSGYTFSGWFTEIFGGEKIEPTTNVSITDPQTLFAHWTANQYTVTFDATGGVSTQPSKSVVFDSPYGDLPNANRVGHTFLEWTEKTNGEKVNSTTTVKIPSNHTLYAAWIVNKYEITFEFENGTKASALLSFNDSITYPNYRPSKSFRKFSKWCTKGENGAKVCDVAYVPAQNLTLTPSFDADSGLISGTVVAAVAGVSFVVLIIVVVFLLIASRALKKKGEFVELEDLGGDGREDELVEERIAGQAEAANIATNLRERIGEHIAKADRNKGVEEVLTGLEVDCKGRGCDDIVESFRTTAASASVAVAIKSGANLIAAAEFLALLYSTVRGEDAFEVFEELYFGMKEIGDFVDKKGDGESICFGGVVSGFTSKRRAIQSLFRNGKEGKVLSGVLFRVLNGKGYRIGKVDEETEEVLLEVGSVFKVESVREVAKGSFLAVDLSFVSPGTENDVIKFL